MSDRTIDADWLRGEALQGILSALSEGGEEARVVGGAVRNHLLGQEIGDIDIATTCLPEETVRRAEAAGYRTVPSGIEHGTVIIVADHRGYETTTLRQDVETDGRRAKVQFGRDWEADARRRDFTVNALYCEADGRIVDPVGGLADIETRTIRFIGDPEHRIREDYLRILRFFRFFAWYGDGRPDAKGLLACARLKDGLAGLSAERVWAEMRRLLEAPDPGRALLWMRQTGVLSAVLPESEKWGIDAIAPLVAAEKAFRWPPRAMLRLAAMIPRTEEHARAVAGRWKLSNAERDRLIDWAQAPEVTAETSEAALAKLLYRSKSHAVADRLRLALASARAKAESNPEWLETVAALVRLVRFAEEWKRPKFPLTGADMIAAGHRSGPAVGETLRALEESWIDSGFTLTREALLERIPDPAKSG
ncbi:CCA tRNA nucleotidyltransferase [Oricola thermophila]|uniref:CCA tRNA nucleotidyltransferase n=1 Tax=Oricola thermophila TaxID=2742145 RepID=A0A6N1VDH7_9HYPH|nr:CCA tRNA nucleotidyltransferase [Oricola thermophila]QKV17087.1 CCA tRNA nucleotidyltransferase [Oricola thermophila]